VVLEERRRDRQAELRRPRQVVDVVALDRGGERRPLVLEVGDEIFQRRGIEHGPRQHVRAGFARFLEHRDRERLASFFFLQLCEPQRSRHPGGPAADNQHIDFQGLALAHATY
jgi:hypothetical protein